MSSSSAAALNGYRRLLKSASIVFKNDSYALKQAKIQLKNEFIKNKYVTSSNELKQLFRGIDEVDEMLKFNIVQGKLNEKGNYGKKYIHTYKTISINLKYRHNFNNNDNNNLLSC